jgi:hypothetical protein
LRGKSHDAGRGQNHHLTEAPRRMRESVPPCRRTDPCTSLHSQTKALQSHPQPENTQNEHQLDKAIIIMKYSFLFVKISIFIWSEFYEL